MKKEIKNPEAPMGRRDNIKRTPRVRLSCTMVQLRILDELIRTHYLHHPEDEHDSEYADLHLRVIGHIEQMQTPLMKEVENMPLFDVFDGEING